MKCLLFYGFFSLIQKLTNLALLVSIFVFFVVVRGTFELIRAKKPQLGLIHAASQLDQRDRHWLRFHQQRLVDSSRLGRICEQI